EFIDAWNAGRRPDVDDYVARAPAGERAALADDLVAFLSFAPTPAFTDASLEAIRAEPAVARALAAPGEQGGLLPALLVRLRERFGITTPQLAEELAPALGLRADQVEKTAGYLGRLEHGSLEPARVSRRVFEALARVFGVPRDELEGAADVGGWGPRVSAAAAPVFRADQDAAEAVASHLEVLADALEAPGGERRDEVDDLFLGGR
ncbi:MAG: helix-turn-helix transcriptional regulator, partial [Actinomycetota bacterium]|nr:helix-turn-helix transcriptional regulator [Actinomycetota bacterium]